MAKPKDIMEIKFWQKDNPGNYCYYPVKETTLSTEITQQATIQRGLMGRDEMKIVISHSVNP